MRNIFILILTIVLINGCRTEKAPLIIQQDDTRIQYAGRLGQQEAATEMYWSGSSVKLTFEGNSIAALLQDNTGDNYYNVIIDQDSIAVLRPDTTKRYYTLAENLDKGPHTLELFKRTEWTRGTSSFYGFRVSGAASKVLETKKPQRKIEFYGNSISAGYAVEDYSGKDSPDSTFTNNYLSYTALTARNFAAEYRCICRSGIGIMISWFPLTMPELYDRLNPNDSLSQWDFSNYTPDIVVVNLFQNDSWIVNIPEHPQFIEKFGKEKPSEEFIIDAYANFIQTIRKEYPNAHIIDMLGNMDITQEESPWPNYVKEAVYRLADPKMHSLFVPFKDTGGHPSIEEQEILANALTAYIKENIDW